MNEVEKQRGYEFSSDQTSLMMAAAKRLKSITQIKFELFVKTVDEDQAFELRVNDASLDIDREVLTLQSMLVSGGPPVFAVFSFEGEPVGPRPVYASFVEALMHAESFALALVEPFKKQSGGDARAPAPPAKLANAGPAYRDYGPTNEVRTSASASFNSGILSESEIELVHAFARGIGDSARARGFAKFVESRVGILSIALGFVGSDDVPVLLGTVVAAARERGGYECSVSATLGQPIPGPDRYPNVMAAFMGTQPYFAHMASALGSRPTSFLGRVRKGLGL